MFLLHQQIAIVPLRSNLTNDFFCDGQRQKSVDYNDHVIAEVDFGAELFESIDVDSIVAQASRQAFDERVSLWER